MTVTLPHLALDAALVVGLLAASLIEWTAAVDYCDNTDYSGWSCSDNKIAWAIACGVISTFFALCLLAFFYFNHSAGPSSTYNYVALTILLILVVFWAFGAGFNTSTTGPFAAPSNGYFSTWAALLLSVVLADILLIRSFGDRFEQHLNFSSPLIIFVASVVELGSAGDALHNGNYSDSGRAKWAVAVGAISLFFTLCQLIFLYLQVPFAYTVAKPLSLFLVALWAAGAGVNTSIKGPFVLTGNGFFFSWIAFAASIYYAYCVWCLPPEASSAPPTQSGAAAAAAAPPAGAATNNTSTSSLPQATTAPPKSSNLDSVVSDI